jgi:hypothetical protein
MTTLRKMAVVLAGCCCGAAALAQTNAPAAAGAPYPAEEIHDRRTGPDDALVDVRVACSRWPDCYDNASAIRDIFRLEGVREGADEPRALALWTWFRTLVTATGGGYTYERGTDGHDRIVLDPHRIFTVYGHHMCDGLSWAMVPLWRAGGYIAFDECHWGHTIASLRYRDADGLERFHDFDPQSRYYFWDAAHRRVSTWTMPVLRGRVHRHLMGPQQVHTLFTTLRLGEVVERRWTNDGHVIPTGDSHATGIVLKTSYDQKYYLYTPGRTDGVYAVAGEELQTFAPPLVPAEFARALAEGSSNTACTVMPDGAGLLHAARAGEGARFVYRLPSPYVAIEGTLEAVLVKAADNDVCRLWLSPDAGVTWQPLHAAARAGEERVSIPLGMAARLAGRPDVFSRYEFRVALECRSERGGPGTGARDLRISVHRELNMRTLPNLRPGMNVLRIDAERLAPGRCLAFELAYAVRGERRTLARRIDRFPFYAAVETGPAAELAERNYDQRFNIGDIRMERLRLALVPAGEAPADVSLPADEARRAFDAPYPHPAPDREGRPVKVAERAWQETSGFFPQYTNVLRNTAAMTNLIARLRSGNVGEQWRAAEDLGDYPEALDALLAAVPEANGDLLLFLCKALAQQRAPAAAAPLLQRWREAPQGAPGTRYIPDVLAAIGDRAAVPALVEPLHRVRFDFRFHIAYALGELGGPEAEVALRDLEARDPDPALRRFAAECLARARAPRP